MSKPPRKGIAQAAPPVQSLEAKGLADILRQGKHIQILVNGVSFEVSPELEAAVRRACDAANRPLPEEMTTTQAADFLDVSRPFVVKLIRRGELPCRLVGTHHRIPINALREYREKMFRHARSASDEMAQHSQDLGLYELEGSPSKAR